MNNHQKTELLGEGDLGPCIGKCCWCGLKLYGDSGPERMQQHTQECPTHPMRRVERLNGELQMEVNQLRLRVLELELLQQKIRELARMVGDPNPDNRGHEWCPGVLKQCIRCGAFRDVPRSGLQLCDPTKLEGQVAYCCECVATYPRSDLIRGEIYCPKCRERVTT